MDFVSAGIRIKRNVNEVYPKFKILPSKDLMIRGRDFFAAYNEQTGLWSKNEFDVIYQIDEMLAETAKTISTGPVIVLYLQDAETKMINSWNAYCQQQMRDNYKPLDSNLIFANQTPKREDYATKKLPYNLAEGPTEAYDELVGTLYSPEEKLKLEWAIGAVVTGDSKQIQKFCVLYGDRGTGKSTVLNIIEKLFQGYTAVFDSKSLGNANDLFALEAFKDNPLVAIQHDGDLSRIEDNTKLNSLVSHEKMMMNEKHKNLYEMRFNSFLFMGTNKPVKITDAKSGLLRRLIDIRPTGDKVPPSRYKKLMKQIEFELGGIAYKCMNVYLSNPQMFDEYVPTDMMEKTNDTFNFVKDNFITFKQSDSISVANAWRMYKEYCEDAKVQYALNKRAFKEEFSNYWVSFQDDRYSGFKAQAIDTGFVAVRTKKEEKKVTNIFEKTESLLDKLYADCPAQYSKEDGTPIAKWDNVTTTLKDIDTTKEHYVLPLENHIVIDFDLKDANGEKSQELNIQEALKWPKTYGEFSKSGKGVHLHYIYDGDVTKLSRIYAPDIEIKVFTGKSSLRRRLTYCNDNEIFHINGGLPLKEEGRMYNKDIIANEKILRTQIKRALCKEIWPNTKPSIDFIKMILDDAYTKKVKYDVTDLKPDIMVFASKSTHQAQACIKLVNQMMFKSEDDSFEALPATEESPIWFFDCEVFKNFFLVVAKLQGEEKFIKLINPTPDDISNLCNKKLVGFNCREYDNHILYGRILGLSNIDLYHLSQNIITGNGKAKYRDAYNISYTDIYDYARDKMGLKKWEIKLGIHHHELNFDWDEEVPEEMWEEVIGYCVDDVRATEAVFNATEGDFTARLILADVAGLTPNDTTNTLTTRIIFGTERHPKLQYTHLEETFPGYEYRQMTMEEALANGLKAPDNFKHNMYRGVDLGKGGYVYAEPGCYENVALLDVASLHPHSALAMRYFGDYDQKFRDLVQARIYIKHKEFDKLETLFDGKFSKYAKDPSQAKALSNALKLAINSVYGLTSASFENPFVISENENNIIALRGALFMKTLQDEVTERGFTVAHIKTDSIKIPNATPEIIQFCMDFANKYEYDFEHEATYEKICLVNDAVYIAKDASDGHWTATGTQFQVPYVFKTLFTREPLTYDDLCVTKSVQTAMYLDLNENLLPDDHNYMFVGKVGYFVPVIDGNNGGILLRKAKDKEGNIKYDSVVGTKRDNGVPYRFLESESGNMDIVDYSYWINMANKAIETISQYTDFEIFRQ